MTKCIKRKVILSGELSARFGREHELAVNSPAEAIRALCANFPEFRDFVSTSEDRNVAYRVITDREVMPGIEDINNPFSQTLHIVPVISGAGGGFKKFAKIVVGAALIAASFYLPVAPLLSGFTFSLSSIAFGIGQSLVLGGISSILSPQPKTAAGAAEPRYGTTDSSSTSADNQPSYTFNGPVNTTAQGHPVPVGYGRMIVGSAVISAGITSDEYGAAGVA